MLQSIRANVLVLISFAYTRFPALVTRYLCLQLQREDLVMANVS